MSIEVLLRQVPELRQRAGEIAEEQDDEPRLGELLDALADLVINELAGGRQPRTTPAGEDTRTAPGGQERGKAEGPDEGAEEETLGRWFGAVEALAADGDEDDVAFLVGSAFLDSLGPQIRTLAEPWLGPATQAILADLDAGWPREDHLAWDAQDPEDHDEDPDDEDDAAPYRR